ncbi:hypothetical protein L6164_009169 [Bauhinia variegata]|uniref:Uncharacterized protein n=1 Tax=Bauhinia variegata TaxID=167791 RepID=A0ACB9PJ00_BAUVA|nr:hypothetical protein L6164_009169 [Bauhinia variegata]
MAAAAPSADNAADLLQNLSLNPDSKTIEMSESAKKTGSVFSVGRNGMAEPFIPNAYPSTAFYCRGYDGQGNDWNGHSRYMNIDGGMAQCVYGDGYSYTDHKGYGYTPYGAYPPPGSSVSSMQHHGQLYGLQQYQYPCPYYHSSASNDSLNKGNCSGKANDDCANEIKALLNSSLTCNDSDQRASSASLFSDRQSKQGERAGLSSNLMPLPQFTNLLGARPTSGLEMTLGRKSGTYPSIRMYSQYRNTFGSNSHFGSASFGSRIGSVDNRLKATRNSYGGVDHGKKNTDGFSELSKGPRAKNSDSKNGKGLEPVTLLVKGQSLPMISDNKEVPVVPREQQYNREEFSENYSGAKFFVIKSYSEDDIHKSIKYSVWASTPSGNKKLHTAYQEAKEKPGGCPIFLLFSVNTSGQFVGLAEMVGPVDFDRTVEYWQQDKWTGCFPVKWHIVKDVPNSVLRHITLENNENKPVTNSRDTQEVKFEKGIEILKIFKAHSSKTCILDDFGFYERKSREQLFQKQVNKPNDLSLTTIGRVALPESLDGTLVNKLASADAAVRVDAVVKLSEENGLKTASEEPSAAKSMTVPDRELASSGDASVC